MIKSLEMVVFLTDAEGYILYALGEGEIWDYCRAKNAVVGSSFHERFGGTTAPAMALRLGRPYQMIAEEHYLKAVHVATCAAAPIRDSSGKIIGSLDITASYETALRHPHTLGMISAGALHDVHHGLAVGVCNLYVMEFNMKATPHVYASAARALGVKDDGLSDEALGMRGIEKLRDLYSRVGVKHTLKDYGFPTDPGTIERLIEQSMDDPCMAFNPVGIERTPEFERLVKSCVGV